MDRLNSAKHFCTAFSYRCDFLWLEPFCSVSSPVSLSSLLVLLGLMSMIILWAFSGGSLLFLLKVLLSSCNWLTIFSPLAAYQPFLSQVVINLVQVSIKNFELVWIFNLVSPCADAFSSAAVAAWISAAVSVCLTLTGAEMFQGWS